jgi:hypothetical protein
MFPHFLEGNIGQPVIKDVRQITYKLAMTIMTNVLYEYLALERKDLDKEKGKVRACGRLEHRLSSSCLL